MPMKVNGKSLGGPRIVTLVLPYGEADDFIVFKFRALTVKDNFEEIMPRPKPRKLILPNNQEKFDYDDPKYKEAFDSWGTQKVNWEFLKSISVTDGLEWETVDMTDPNTWANWRQDLESNFGMVEFNRVFGGFIEANSLSDDKIEAARNRFLAGQEPGQ